MEDILELYAESYDADKPVVCFDERPYQMVEETRLPLRARPGKVKRYDYEYKRKGTCNLFIFFQPLLGWRHVKVTERRTKEDFAYCMKELADVYFPETEKIRVVLDNLNTHTPASLYEVFPAEEARRISKRLEFHYTPRHGSWLNMVELEISVLSRQCLDRRLSGVELVEKETAAWEKDRNEKKTTVNWQFNLGNARLKLRNFYTS